MAWERKRGKLEEFNRLLAGDPATSFTLHEGDRTHLDGVRYVVTLDVDTVLPKGALARLVGTLAHPLNRAEFDEASGRVRTATPSCNRASRSRRSAAIVRSSLDGSPATRPSTSTAAPSPTCIRTSSGPASTSARAPTTSRRFAAASRAACRRTRSRATISSKASTVAPRSRRTSCCTKPFPGSISNSLAASIAGSVATGSSFRGSGDPCRAPAAVVFAIVWRGSIDGRSSTTFVAVCCRRRSSRCWSQGG